MSTVSRDQGRKNRDVSASQFGEDTPVLWEGERIVRTFLQGQLSGSIESKAFVHILRGIPTVSVVLYDADGHPEQRLDVGLKQDPIDLVKAFRVFCLFDALPSINLTSEQFKAWSTALVSAIFHPDVLKRDRRLSHEIGKLQAMIGQERFAALSESWPTHLDRVVTTCANAHIGFDADALSQAMADGKIPVTNYLIREYGVEHPDARAKRLVDEETYLKQFDAPIAAVCQSLRIDVEANRQSCRRLMLELRSIDMTAVDLCIGVLAWRLLASVQARQSRMTVSQTFASKLFGLPFGGDVLLLESSHDAEAPHPAVMHLDCLQQAIALATKVTGSKRKARKFQWAIDGIVTELTATQIAKKKDVR